MARLILVVLWFCLALATPTMAQVRVTVPTQQYKKHDEIHAKIENTGNDSVTFCVEFGQTSMKGDDVESTPSPFLVQRNDNAKWGTLMIGPDVGGARAAVLLDAGKSMEFAFRLNDSGRMRLRFNYWRGAIPKLDCHNPPKGLRQATSSAFAIE